MALGINKDLEPLARLVRRSGGAVTITKRNYVVWTMPEGQVIRSGLTMSGSTAHRKHREILKALSTGSGNKIIENLGRLLHIRGEATRRMSECARGDWRRKDASREAGAGGSRA